MFTEGTFVQKGLLASGVFISSLMNFATDTEFDGYSDRPAWTQGVEHGRS
jgi:hypothetical protein